MADLWKMQRGKADDGVIQQNVAAFFICSGEWKKEVERENDTKIGEKHGRKK